METIAVTTIPIGQVKAATFNYRHTDKNITELAESIKHKGILQPLIVRSIGPEGNQYEVVAGHRRLKAAQKAGLKEIPVFIRELSDAEAQEIMIIENSQREDVPPMEEAEGFQKLLKSMEAEEIAKKIDKSVRYVLERVKLNDLSDKAKDALRKEKMSITHALVLTRLDNKKFQDDAVKEIVSNELTVSGLKSHLVHRYGAELSAAVFDKKDCEGCQNNSRNQSALFPELSKAPAECCDKECFKKKTVDHFNSVLAKLKDEGFKILSMKAVQEYSGYGHKGSEEIELTGYRASKKYKTDCAKCLEHHAFGLHEGYNGLCIKEFCLNPSCLRKMNAEPKSDKAVGAQSSGGVSSSTLTQHARNCRDRFLRKTVPEKMTDVVRKRLTLYHLVCSARSQGNGLEAVHLFEIYSEILGKPLREFSQYGFSEPDVIKKFVGKLPEKKLDEAISKALVTICGHGTNTDVLLLLAPEAKINMEKDFPVDKEWLNTKTKSDLLKYIKSAGLKCEVTETSKKAEIVEAVLKHDLKGKLPKEVKSVCNIGGKA